MGAGANTNRIKAPPTNKGKGIMPLGGNHIRKKGRGWGGGNSKAPSENTSLLTWKWANRAGYDQEGT